MEQMPGPQHISGSEEQFIVEEIGQSDSFHDTEV